MKHACYDNIGYVLEQEGDSFTVAFHEPQDAVAFTLQVLLEQGPALRSHHRAAPLTYSIIADKLKWWQLFSRHQTMLYSTNAIKHVVREDAWPWHVSAAADASASHEPSRCFSRPGYSAASSEA